MWLLGGGLRNGPAPPVTGHCPQLPRPLPSTWGRLAASGRAMATIELARAAAGIAKGDNPARHPVVAEAVKGWRNQAAAPRQSAALTAARVRETARLPGRGRGGRMESAAVAQP